MRASATGRSALRATAGLLALWLAVACQVVVAAAQAPSVPAPLAPSSLLLDIARAGDRLVAVGERGHILLSDDNGESWRQVVAPTRATLTAVTFADARAGWAVGHDAVVLHTADGGDSWTLQYADPDFETPLMDVRFADRSRGFAVGAYGLFLETADGGASWEPRLVSEDEFHFNAILRPEPDRWFMAGEFGGLYRSDDGGAGWETLDSPYEGSFFGALALGGDDLLVFGLQGTVFRSADGGDSWQEVETGTSSGLVAGTVLSDGRVVLVGLGGAVLVSADAGRSFALGRRSDRVALSSIVEAPDGRIVLVGEAGALAMSRDRLAALSDAEAVR